MAERLAEPPDVAEQLPLLPALREVLASEGHIADWPLFALHAKVARPTKPHPEGHCGPDGKILRVRDLDPAKYRRDVVMHGRDPVTGKARVQRCLIVCNPEWGWPDDVAQRVTYALSRFWEEQRREDDPRVYASRKELCRAAGLGTGGNKIDRLELALNAMKNQHVELFNAYMERIPGERRRAPAPGGKTFSLVAGWDFRTEVGGRSRGRRDYLRELARSPVTVEAVPGLPYVQLGQNLFESLRSRYLQPADSEYANQLGPLARRFYYLFNKRMGHDKWSWETPLEVLIKRAPIGGRHAERDASEALEELKTPVLVGGRRVRFLSHSEWFWSKGGDRMLRIVFEGRTPLRALRERIRGGGEAGASDADDQDDGVVQGE